MVLVPLALATAGILGLSLWRRATPLGVPIPPIDVPQGKTLRCNFTFKNTGAVRVKFQALFGFKGRVVKPLPTPVELDPEASTTIYIDYPISTDFPVGTYGTILQITGVMPDGTPDTAKVYDTSEGTANVISGVAAQITAVSLSVY